MTTLPRSSLVLLLVYILLASAALVPTVAAAETTAPTPTATLTLISAGTPTIVTINRWSPLYPFSKSSAYTEVPPWNIRGGWNSYLLTTGWTYISATRDNLVNGSITLEQKYSAQVSGPDDDKPWVRSYNGVYSGYLLNPSSARPTILGAVHGENENQHLADGALIQNTVNTNFSVNPNFDVHTCASKVNAFTGSYDLCTDAYNAFISLAQTPFTEATNYGSRPLQNDGPIVWPTDGYTRADGSKASQGVRHPTFFSDGTYLYVYYKDESSSSWGIKVAQAPLSSMPSATVFRSYANGSFSVPSLPAGFDKNSISSFYSARGPAVPCNVGCSGSPIRFSVAAVEGTSYYVGALDDWYDGVTLSLSTDLVHWSSPVRVVGASARKDAKMHYAIFLNKTGTNNMSVDLSDFYLEGTDAYMNTVLMHVSAKINQIASPPPSP